MNSDTEFPDLNEERDLEEAMKFPSRRLKQRKIYSNCRKNNEDIVNSVE